jgi:hypothetical protein
MTPALIRRQCQWMRHSPSVLADARQPSEYYCRLQYPEDLRRVAFLPLHRCETLTLIPFRNWTVREIVELNLLFGQRVNLSLQPKGQP